MTYPDQRIQVKAEILLRRRNADQQLRMHQYTTIDDLTRLRFLAACKSTYSSAAFRGKLFK